MTTTATIKDGWLVFAGGPFGEHRLSLAPGVTNADRAEAHARGYAEQAREDGERLAAQARALFDPKAALKDGEAKLVKQAAARALHFNTAGNLAYLGTEFDRRGRRVAVVLAVTPSTGTERLLRVHLDEGLRAKNTGIANVDAGVLPRSFPSYLVPVVERLRARRARRLQERTHEKNREARLADLARPLTRWGVTDSPAGRRYRKGRNA
jgi:hypothetical protein